MKLTRTTPINLDAAIQTKSSLLLSNTGVTQSCSTTTTSSSHHEQNPEDDDAVFVMSPQVAQHLVSRTEKRVQDILAMSQWVRNHSQLSRIPLVDSTDFVMGKIIAKGGFSNIHEITSLSKDLSSSSSSSSENTQANTKYVVKHLQPNLALNPNRLRSAARDICNEIHVLAALDHPHIVQIKALSSGGLSGFASTCRADSFFLVLERMESSLLHKLTQWRRHGVLHGALNLQQVGKCDKTTQLFVERLTVSQQIASALTYLHERRIMHRDIKPGNICFDAQGCLKLIDFGLAVELPADKNDKNDDNNDTATFSLGNAGTARYQAPEVISKKPYNLQAEIYSFSIVLWEIMALTKPFEQLGTAQVKESVAQFGQRPALSRSWPRALRKLLQKAWAKRPSQRPSMAELHAALKTMAQDAPTCRLHKNKNWFVPRLFQ